MKLRLYFFDTIYRSPHLLAGKAFFQICVLVGGISSSGLQCFGVAFCDGKQSECCPAGFAGSIFPGNGSDLWNIEKGCELGLRKAERCPSGTNLFWRNGFDWLWNSNVSFLYGFGSRCKSFDA